MSRQVSPSTDKIYGLQRVARASGACRGRLSIATAAQPEWLSASGLDHAGPRRMTIWWRRSATS